MDVEHQLNPHPSDQITAMADGYHRMKNALGLLSHCVLSKDFTVADIHSIARSAVDEKPEY